MLMGEEQGLVINFDNEKLGLFVEDCTNKLNLVLLNTTLVNMNFISL